VAYTVHLHSVSREDERRQQVKQAPHVSQPIRPKGHKKTKRKT